MKDTKELVARKMSELVQEGMPFDCISLTALTDIVQDLYCIAQGWHELPTDTSAYDQVHDWACATAQSMIDGFIK